MTKSEYRRYKQFKAVMRIFHCNEAQAKNIIAFNCNKIYSTKIVKNIRNCEAYHLIPSLDLKNTYYLFTNIAEKKLITDGFKILNSDDFSEVELDWLEKNYKFRCKSKYICNLLKK